MLTRSVSCETSRRIRLRMTVNDFGSLIYSYGEASCHDHLRFPSHCPIPTSPASSHLPTQFPRVSSDGRPASSGSIYGDGGNFSNNRIARPITTSMSAIAPIIIRIYERPGPTSYRQSAIRRARDSLDSSFIRLAFTVPSLLPLRGMSDGFTRVITRFLCRLFVASPQTDWQTTLLRPFSYFHYSYSVPVPRPWRLLLGEFARVFPRPISIPLTLLDRPSRGSTIFPVSLYRCTRAGITENGRELRFLAQWISSSSAMADGRLSILPAIYFSLGNNRNPT